MSQSSKDKRKKSETTKAEERIDLLKERLISKTTYGDYDPSIYCIATCCTQYVVETLTPVNRCKKCGERPTHTRPVTQDEYPNLPMIS